MIEHRLGNGFVVHHYQHVDSTNNVAASLCRNGWRDQLAIIADHQSQGRGRHGRVWQAPAGNLNLSIVWANQPDIGPLWSPVTGLAVSEAIETLVPGLTIALKWPNDIMLGDAKLGGVLIERPAPESPLVIGIGINVAMAPDQLDRAATALFHHGFHGAASELGYTILDSLLRWRHQLCRFSQTGRALIIEQLQKRCLGMGQRAAWAAGNQRVVGVACGLDDDGAFLIEDDAGKKIRVLAGEVGFLCC